MLLLVPEQQGGSETQAATWKPKMQARAHILREVLLHGNPWEIRTPAVLAALLKRSPQKRVQKKRLGSNAAQRLGQFDNPGEVLTDEERTVFRALAARAKYLSLDRPGCAFHATSFARNSAGPTPDPLTGSAGMSASWSACRGWCTHMTSKRT